MSQQVHVDLTDSSALANICLGKQQNIEGQLAQLRDAGAPQLAPEMVLVSILEAQSVILMALASLHITRAQRATPAGIVMPRIVGARG